MQMYLVLASVTLLLLASIDTSLSVHQLGIAVRQSPTKKASDDESVADIVSNGDRIVNGKVASERQLQSVVLVNLTFTTRYKAGYSLSIGVGLIPFYLTRKFAYYCTGVLVTNDTVLTAAHCTADLNSHPNLEESSIVVNIGVLDSGNLCNKIGYTTRKIILHPDYNRSSGSPMRNDIALLKMSTPCSDCVPVCLPNASNDNDLVNKTVQVSGWGPIKSNLDPNQPHPQIHDLTVMSHADCQRLLADANIMVDNESICAQSAANVNTGTCIGDSGGPLTREVDGKIELVGTGQLPTRSTCERGIDVFLSTTSVLNFINENI